MYENILYELTNGIGRITLNRPSVYNALSPGLIHDITTAVEAAGADDSVRVLVITGTGDRAFCSGADLNTVGDAGFLDALYAMLQRVVEVPVPVVAAVNGPAIGAGTQLAIAADLRVVDPGAVFGLPTAGLGLAVDPWTVRRLALLAGGGPARRMLLACERLDVTAAAGLVDRLGTPDDALAWATEMAGLAPLTLAYNKLAVNRLLEDATDPETLAAVGAAFSACWASDDLVEGRRAREEKRAPRFVGK